jgi:hypothetical protein
MDKIKIKIEGNFLKIMKEENFNQMLFIKNFSKISLFECKEELIEMGVNKYIELIKIKDIKILKKLEEYVSFTQIYLKENYRDLIVNEYLNYFDNEKTENFSSSIKLYFLLNELQISKNNSELDIKLKEKIEKISADQKFLKEFIKVYIMETNEFYNKYIYITNHGFSRFVNFLQKLSKKEDFLKNNDNILISKL